mmetsp:Transcript_51132/g.82901  ORF Transcript_51132/g.82901 Transcript_51132/m.82901 type:complete len:205 (-) Transcript_51132:10-624(-)
MLEQLVPQSRSPTHYGALAGQFHWSPKQTLCLLRKQWSRRRCGWCHLQCASSPQARDRAQNFFRAMARLVSACVRCQCDRSNPCRRPKATPCLGHPGHNCGNPHKRPSAPLRHLAWQLGAARHLKAHHLLHLRKGGQGRHRHCSPRSTSLHLRRHTARASSQLQCHRSAFPRGTSSKWVSVFPADHRRGLTDRTRRCHVRRCPQ